MRQAKYIMGNEKKQARQAFKAPERAFKFSEDDY